MNWKLYIYDGLHSDPWSRVTIDDKKARSLISRLLARGWHLHPYNRDGNDFWYEWIITKDPLISDAGRAFRFVRYDF